MDWTRQQHILQKWQPFGVPQMQLQQQLNPIQHQQLQVQHQQQQQQQQQQVQPPPQQAHQPPQQQTFHQLQPHQPQHVQQQNNKGSKAAGGSGTPHCLVCNVHLGMFAKGGMEIFSDKIITTYGKQQVHNVLSSIVNQELINSVVHSSIVCKKCYKLVDDIDAMEDKLVSMKQVVSTKFTMTLALVKKGLVGKAVIEDASKDPIALEAKAKKISKLQERAAEKPKNPLKRSRKNGKPRKTGSLSVKAGKVVVKQIEEQLEDSHDEDDMDEDNLAVVVIDEASINHQFDINNPFMCSICDRTFKTRECMENHVETHDFKEDFYSCNICEKGFLTKVSLAKHKRVIHKEIKNLKRDCPPYNVAQVKQFRCKQCDKVFSTKSKATDHERTHTGEKPFECDICGVCFRQRGNLSSHKRITHMQEKRYKCNVCGKAFKWKRLLKGHTMSVHTGERPYRCEFCDAGFVYQQHYKKHMRIHTGEKPFKCEICGKAFNSSNNCRAHMFTHSDKKPYECKICGVGFMRKPLVLSHIKQHPHVDDNIEAYVKANSPTVGGMKGESSTSHTERKGIHSKKKMMRDTNQAPAASVAQAPAQNQNTLEDSMPHFVIPDNREQANSAEAMNYVFGTFQSQGTVSHYTPLNLGQW